MTRRIARVASVSARAAVIAAVIMLAAAGATGSGVLAQDLERLVVTAPGGRPLVFHFAARDAGAAAALARGAAPFVPAPVAALTLPPEAFVVVLAPSEAAFAERTGGRVPDWGLAVAIPHDRTIVLRSPRLTGGSGEDPAVVLRHELGHLYLAAAVGRAGAVPRWFDEGFAALYADEWRWANPFRLAWARLAGGLPSLRALEGAFPAVPTPDLAYGQSLAAVRHLRDRGGERGMTLLLARVGEGMSFDAALRATYGLTLAQFYTAWEAELGTRYGWAVALSDDRALWAALAAAAMVLFVLKRRSIRREIGRRRRSEDAALGEPGDHSLGVEEWERYWEHDDDEDWRGDEDDRSV